MRSSSTTRAGAALGVLLASAVMASAAGAQRSSPDAATCSVISGGQGVNNGRTVFPQGGSFRVEGRAGCAPPSAEVHVQAESDRSSFATFRARADGSYRSPPIALPRHLTLGPQRIVVAVEGGREYGTPILIYESVLGSGAEASATAGPRDEPVPAGSTSRGALRYVLLALALLAGGSVIALGAIRRGWSWHAVRGTGLSLGRRRPPIPEALPVPVRSAPIAHATESDSNRALLRAEPVTETDELDDVL